MEPADTTTHAGAHGSELRRARLLVAYHGGSFHGFAPNPEVRTIGGVLREAISTVVRRDVELVVAGRTDAGVHASGQVVSVDLPADTDFFRLLAGVNQMCAPHVSVRNAQWVGDEFNARYSAKWRRYVYTVLNSPAPDPMLADRSWHVRRPLNVAVMQLACDPLIGEHDFTTFCKKPPLRSDGAEKSMKRRVMSATWRDTGTGVLTFEICANAFCHNMVRSIVQLHVDIGKGVRPPSDVRLGIVSRDRSFVPRLAPPEGLCLTEVGYDDEWPTTYPSQTAADDDHGMTAPI